MLVEEVEKENEPVKFLSLTGIAVLVTTTTATADEIPSCPTPAGVSIIEKLSEAPTQLRMALAVDVGEMAEAGADFNATDSINPRLASNRLIFVWHRGAIWIVATEQGGSIAYGDPILTYSLDQSGRAALLEKRRAYPESVCTTATALLNSHWQ